MFRGVGGGRRRICHQLCLPGLGFSLQILIGLYLVLVLRLVIISNQRMKRKRTSLQTPSRFCRGFMMSVILLLLLWRVGRYVASVLVWIQMASLPPFPIASLLVRLRAIFLEFDNCISSSSSVKWSKKVSKLSESTHQPLQLRTRD